MKKRALTLFLALVMCLSLCTPAMAEEDLQLGKEMTNELILTTAASEPGSGTDILPQGDKAPKNVYNLNGRNYTANGTFDTTIYTEYCFYPDATGFLMCNFVIDWGMQLPNARGSSVTCWDKTTGTKVRTVKFVMDENANGLYGPTIETHDIKFYTLNPDHTYYFHISKATDSINATITGIISATK